MAGVVLVVFLCHSQVVGDGEVSRLQHLLSAVVIAVSRVKLIIRYYCETSPVLTVHEVG